MCTEASFLPTGYAVYSKELLSRLHANPLLEVAELSCYTDMDNPLYRQIPWRAYANKPLENSPEMAIYQSSTTNKYGEFTFNTVCMYFRPHFVIDIRDPWMFEFESRSPFRNFFKHILMPTVDSAPQHPEWLDWFSEADGVFTYSEFGLETLANQSNTINLLGVASPCASSDFEILKNKTGNRTEHSIPNDIYLVGTVMRNQPRKLYPDLFQSFRKVLDNTGREDVFLYCHTNYPDVGWEIPDLLMEFNLSNKVLFTYKCKNCSKVSTSFFRDSICQCSNCGHFKNSLAGLGNSLTDTELNKIYNLFDIYVQYANSEGFGMPQLEAAQAGNIVISVDYSAMASVIKSIGAYAVPVLHYSRESDTGCYRAIPDNNAFQEILTKLISKPRHELDQEGSNVSTLTKIIYNWDKTAHAWADYLTSSDTIPDHLTWKSPIAIQKPAPFNPNLMHPKDQANFLVAEVLRKPELIGRYLWRRFMKDLTYGRRLDNTEGNFYFNEHHIKDQVRSKPFSFKDAYGEMIKLREYYNTWEINRRNHK